MNEIVKNINVISIVICAFAMFASYYSGSTNLMIASGFIMLLNALAAMFSIIMGKLS